MYNPTYRLQAIEEAKKIKKVLDEEKYGKNLYKNDKTFSQFADGLVGRGSSIKMERLKEFYDQIIRDDKELLAIDDKVKQIYIKLLNFQVSQKGLDRLKEIGGSIQYIRGNDEKQSKIVNMDYFSVRIDKMPTFANISSNIDAGMLFKKIRDHFLTLSKGSVTFESNCGLPFNSVLGNSINGDWEFIPYPTTAKQELNRWEKQLCYSIFEIKAGGGFKETLAGDHGAVLESEISQNAWIFTTIFTPESDTQPFSGHRQFGIHQDEDGNYRFFTRAIDRIWPSNFISKTNGKECSVLNYLTIADATWTNLIKNVSQFINKNGGKTTIMPTEKNRINFNNFFKKFRSNRPVNFVGNIEQIKTI